MLNVSLLPRNICINEDIVVSYPRGGGKSQSAIHADREFPLCGARCCEQEGKDARCCFRLGQERRVLPRSGVPLERRPGTGRAGHKRAIQQLAEKGCGREAESSPRSWSGLFPLLE